MKKMLEIAKDFSEWPFGRDERHGADNGKRFREELLVPALEGGGDAVVYLDGVNHEYGSSFLEEAFGGLVRDHGFSESELRSRLTIKSVDHEDRLEEIWEYISEADSERHRAAH